VSTAERAGFVAVALTAGVCEEILYRGFLIYALGRVLPSPWVALVPAALIFGIAHAYQGPRGVAGTGLLGVFLGLLYLLSGSLWPGIGLHASVDLVNGMALGPFGRDRSAPPPLPPEPTVGATGFAAP
jgi:membrane protease YdiL (CAAX protease family)